VRETFWLSTNHPVWIRSFLLSRKLYFAVHEPCLSYLRLSILFAKYPLQMILSRFCQVFLLLNAGEFWISTEKVVQYRHSLRLVSSQKRLYCHLLVSQQIFPALVLFLILVKLAFSCGVTMKNQSTLKCRDPGKSNTSYPQLELLLMPDWLLLPWRNPFLYWIQARLLVRLIM
jgi:hypothetical protein